MAETEDPSLSLEEVRGFTKWADPMLRAWDLWTRNITIIEQQVSQVTTTINNTSSIVVRQSGKLKALSRKVSGVEALLVSIKKSMGRLTELERAQKSNTQLINQLMNDNKKLMGINRKNKLEINKLNQKIAGL